MIKPNWHILFMYGQKQICKYTIYQDNKKVECDIIGHITALAHARKWSIDLFEQPRKVEILNQYTGEIITLEEAEIQHAKWQKRR